MLQNILKKHFPTNFKSTCDNAISFEKLAKRSLTPFHLMSFSYLFIYLFIYFLINYKIMMRSICKLTLKVTVAVNNILETGILIVLSLIFRDIQKLWLV